MTAQFPPALVLNADFRPLSYFPLSVLPGQEAVRLAYQGKVAVVAEYERVVRSPSIEMRLPSVIAAKQFIRMPTHTAFTRSNVFLRDGFCCQYCGGEFPPERLTFDHVVPRARGGVSSWENVVAACEPCNTRKGSSMDMQPIRRPRRPKPHELFAAKHLREHRRLHETWIDYLYWDSPLEP